MRFLVILIFFLSFSSHPHQFEKNNIIIKHPILKVSSENAKIGAGYLKIFNNSRNNIFLQEIQSNISEIIELHEVIEENEVYKMRPIKKNLTIKPKEVLELKPKSYHLMFFNIKEKIKDKHMIDAKLIFNDNLVLDIKLKSIVGKSKHKNH